MSRSIVFDTKLLGLGSWEKETEKLVENWISEDRCDEKRAEASNLVYNMIIRLLGQECSENGRIRSRRLGEMLQYFEDLLAITRGGIAKKFYRDHLNHMLRVMLLANAIGNRMKTLSLTKKDIRMLTIAAVVHDIAYPLAESYQIIAETTKAMRRCYSALSFPDYHISYDPKKVARLVRVLTSKDVPASVFEPMLKEYNHGIMGCIEFIDYIKDENLAGNKRLFQAIVFHDPAAKVPESVCSDPILLALVLSDELQDWGRPVGLDKETAISNIDDFRITSGSIGGKFEWRGRINVSPLRQIHSKAVNLRRLQWPKPIRVSLAFKLPDYERFCSHEVEEACSRVLGYCHETRPECIQSLNDLWKNSREWFRAFYGDILPKTNNLVDYWKHMPVSEAGSVYFNPAGNEILHTEKDPGKPRSLELKVRTARVDMILTGQKRGMYGRLYDQSDNRTLKHAYRLVVPMIVFQGLTARIASKKSVELSSRFIFPSKKAIKSAMGIVGIQNWVDGNTDALSSIRRCVVEGGYFNFRSREKSS